MLSQNARFIGPLPPEPDDAHPPGEPLALELQAELQSRGWIVGEPDTWRDAGWVLPCRRGSGELQLIVLCTDEVSRFLQIAPSYIPGIVGRLRGRAPSATPADTYELAKHAHEILRSNGFSAFAWEWDGLPGENSAPEPRAHDASLPRAIVR